MAVAKGIKNRNYQAYKNYCNSGLSTMSYGQFNHNTHLVANLMRLRSGLYMYKKLARKNRYLINGKLIVISDDRIFGNPKYPSYSYDEKTGRRTNYTPAQMAKLVKYLIL